jgi:hypothetical protein
VTKIVSQPGSFNDIGIDDLPQVWVAKFRMNKTLRQSPTNLGNFHAVGQAIVKQRALVGRSNLRHASQTAKGRTIEQAIAISLEGIPERRPFFQVETFAAHDPPS